MDRPLTRRQRRIGNFSTPPVTVDAFGLLVFGMVVGWVIKRIEFLWSASRLHARNNLLVVAVFSARDDRLSGVRYTYRACGARGRSLSMVVRLGKNRQEIWCYP